MKVIIVFSSPNHEEYTKIWELLIGKEHGYIKVNDSGDKIYAFNGRDERYHTEGKWRTGILVDEIGTIIEINNNCECVVMLHNYKIPNELTQRFNNVRFEVYSSGEGTFYDDYVMPFVNGNIQECFDSLWKEIQGNQTTESIPEERTKGHARLLAERIIIHDCNNAITYLSVAIKKLSDDSGLDKMNGKEMISGLGVSFIEEKYNRSMPAYEKIRDAFQNHPAIMAIPEKLANAKGKYAALYNEAKSTDSSSNKDMVDSGQKIIQLLKETIDILEEVIQNG